MTDNVTELKIAVAEAPGKEDMLKLIDTMRVYIEMGQVLAIVVIPICVEEKFDVISAGEIKRTSLAGILGRAQLDALESLKR